jgi:tricorn protease
VPYPLVDGGTITAPASAVFTLNGEWPAEGEGIPPDIDVPLDAKSVAAGRDPQLERGIAEALKLLQQSPVTPLTLPKSSRRARWPVP